MTNEQIKEKVINELSEGFDYSLDGIDPKNISIDFKNKKVIITLDLNIVEEDDYAGVVFY